MRKHLWSTVALLVMVFLAFGSTSSNKSTPPNTADHSPVSNKADSTPPATPSPPANPTLSANETRITKQEFGDAWPFTVDEGILTCKGSGGLGAVVFTANGKTYGVNGIARGMKKYDEIDQIWAPHQSIPGAKKDIGQIIQRGLSLCR